MKSRIWLSPPHMCGKEKKYVQDAFDTNWISPMGPNIDNFEEDLSNYLKIKHVAALTSGTSAIHLSLLILGIKRGDFVISPSFTFSASVNPVIYVGATPVLVDSEKDTWNMDPELLEFAIKDHIKKGKKPKAIILVHLYGMPAKIDDVLKISREYEIPLIEDAAEALGSRYKDKHVGTFGEMGILSFNGNKIITTSGGGALISFNKDFISRAKFYATQSRDDAPHYQHSEVGYNYRMSNVVAGIGRGQMKVLNERINARRDNNSFYKSVLGNLPGIQFQHEPSGHFSNYWLTTILIDPQKTGGITNKDLRVKYENNDIEVRPLWKPMHMQPIFRDAPKYVNGISEKLFQLGLCLPSGSNLSINDKERIINIFFDTLNIKQHHKFKDTIQKETKIQVPFSPPRIDTNIIQSVAEALQSGWITTGPRTRKFEEKITNYCGNTETLCVNSATMGLELVLRWFGVEKDDEVILPAYTYCATGNVVLRCGAKPVLVDINPDDLLMNIESVEENINENTKVILPVDFGGLPCDYDKINNLVRSEHIRKKFKPKSKVQTDIGRILVLSDAAHSFGAIYKGRKTGTLTDITVFSFHAVKNLTTAEGGAIALNLPAPLNNKEIYNYMRVFSLHGQTKDALLKLIEGGWKYDVIVPGMKANMTDILAAIGLVEIERYDETLVKLRWIFERYDSLFSHFPWAELPQYSNKEKSSAYHIYPLRINGFSEKQRDEVIERCQKDGVMVNVHYQPLSMFTAYSRMGYSKEDTPVSYKVYTKEISLPVFYDLSEEQIKTVVSSIARSVQAVIEKRS